MIKYDLFWNARKLKYMKNNQFSYRKRKKITERKTA
jgi:hypothetical protein